MVIMKWYVRTHQTFGNLLPKATFQVGFNLFYNMYMQVLIKYFFRRPLYQTNWNILTDCEEATGFVEKRQLLSEDNPVAYLWLIIYLDVKLSIVRINIYPTCIY